MAKNLEKNLEKVQRDWDMNPLPYSFPCDVSKEIYLNLYVLKLKYLKTCAEAKKDLYDKMIKLIEKKE